MLILGLKGSKDKHAIIEIVFRLIERSALHWDMVKSGLHKGHQVNKRTTILTEQ